MRDERIKVSAASKRPGQHRPNDPPPAEKPTSVGHQQLTNASVDAAVDPPVVMTMSFIRQQINMGIHEIMYQVSGIVKPMVHNEVQQVRELEANKLISQCCSS
ncbi:hypothetical protein TSUD_35340 [Trifolium subterraneum]|uniref:Uncharacterized protein n=1 Tax=Trifolium subterraneum TaxID=3900 RepID=A0A2Z6LR98_TRISU|nr:hypothetical protein TSUD_35340 [Trifolium subterraneum]